METLRQYAAQQMARLLARLAFEIRRASIHSDPEAIHDLRVSIRRFQQALRVFKSLFPDKEVRRIRKRLRRLMLAAATVRDLDIAADLFRNAGLTPESPLWGTLAAERRRARRTLVDEISRLSRKDYSARWREALGLTPL